MTPVHACGELGSNHWISLKIRKLDFLKHPQLFLLVPISMSLSENGMVEFYLGYCEKRSQKSKDFPRRPSFSSIEDGLCPAVEDRAYCLCTHKICDGERPWRDVLPKEVRAIWKLMKQQGHVWRSRTLLSS